MTPDQESIQSFKNIRRVAVDPVLNAVNRLALGIDPWHEYVAADTLYPSQTRAW
jgi:hypothetical protein